LPFLLTHQIPFTLTSIGSSSELKGIDKNEVMAEQMKLAQKIYQKYIVEFIEKTPSKGEEIAAEMGVSEAQFKALFKKCYGKPFYQMYVEHKMEHAAQLLREEYASVVVSERIGYAHPIKFNKMFQKYFGMTPKKYQRSLS
jgi:AraC-like DNA-binding protein